MTEGGGLVGLSLPDKMLLLSLLTERDEKVLRRVRGRRFGDRGRSLSLVVGKLEG